MEEVTISIPRMYAEKLSTWASVGRTVDEAVRLLQLCAGEIVSEEWEERSIACETELSALKQALDACNAACKSWRVSQEYKELHSENPPT